MYESSCFPIQASKAFLYQKYLFGFLFLDYKALSFFRHDNNGVKIQI